MPLDDRARARLDQLERSGLTRWPPTIERPDGPEYTVHGRRVVGFCSNDYLGLAGDPHLSNTAAPGCGASRLVCGQHPIHEHVERRLADHVGYADAVLFPSGYQLSTSVLPTLIESSDHVASDALNHASLIDGLRLSKATIDILPHGQPPNEARHQWWVGESIYSMDGDAIDPTSIATAHRNAIMTYIDEAHALGLFPRGRGLLGQGPTQPDVLIGTLGKAFGCAGAFIACSRPVGALIRSRARGFVFSTGIAPTIAHSIDRAIDLVQGDLGDERRDALWTRVRRFAEALAFANWRSPIFPVVIGPNVKTLEIAAKLLDDGFHIQPIRPPTVPEGTARLRITLSATHPLSAIDRLIERLHVHLGSSAPVTPPARLGGVHRS